MSTGGFSWLVRLVASNPFQTSVLVDFHPEISRILHRGGLDPDISLDRDFTGHLLRRLQCGVLEPVVRCAISPRGISTPLIIPLREPDCQQCWLRPRTGGGIWG